MLVALACGVLISTALDHGGPMQGEPAIKPVPLEQPTLSIVSGRERLVIHGTSKSAAHESALLQLAAEHFDGFDTKSDFSTDVILPENWESTSSRLLYTLAAMDSAQAVMRESSISIRGVTSNGETYAARLEFLRENLADDVLLDADVLTSVQATSATEICERVFANLIAAPVEFMKSSEEIRNASLATLDRIAEFALDCRGTIISITGHTDASGDESWNRQLSLARAQAVADHLIDRGVGAARLLVSGSGSAEPIADNTTARGRELNRRIEFALQ